MSKSLTAKATGLLSETDRTILRLNKLLSAPGGLSSVLSTLNYTVYFLTHVHAKANPALKGPSHIAALAGLLSRTRTSLRLFGLIPIYAWAKSLASGPKPGQDAVLYYTSVAQCALYASYQFFENVSFLTDNKILPHSVTARWTGAAGGATDGLWLISNRSWMLGVACDVVRLAREAQLERYKRSQRGSAAPSRRAEDVKADQQWWSDVVVTFGWLPVAYHYAEWTPGGIPGWNLGIMGVSGGIAGIGRTRALWAATADV